MARSRRSSCSTMANHTLTTTSHFVLRTLRHWVFSRSRWERIPDVKFAIPLSGSKRHATHSSSAAATTASRGEETEGLRAKREAEAERALFADTPARVPSFPFVPEQMPEAVSARRIKLGEEGDEAEDGETTRMSKPRHRGGGGGGGGFTEGEMEAEGRREEGSRVVQPSDSPATTTTTTTTTTTIISPPPSLATSVAGSEHLRESSGFNSPASSPSRLPEKRGSTSTSSNIIINNNNTQGPRKIGMSGLRELSGPVEILTAQHTMLSGYLAKWRPIYAVLDLHVGDRYARSSTRKNRKNLILI